MTNNEFEVVKMTLPILLTAILARLQRKKDLKDIQRGKKKPTDFHHFIK